MLRTSKVVREIREKLDGYEHRQNLRDQAKAHRWKRQDLMRLIRQGLMNNLENAIEACGWLPARCKVTDGTYGTKRLHIDTGDMMTFGPDGTFICRASIIAYPPDFWATDASSGEDTSHRGPVPSDAQTS